MIFIHLFIHAEHLYSNSSIKLLRGAPSSSMAKMSSLKVRKGSSKKVKSEAVVPGPGCTVLSRANRIRRTYCKEKNVSRDGTGKREKVKTLLGGAECLQRRYGQKGQGEDPAGMSRMSPEMAHSSYVAQGLKT